MNSTESFMERYSDRRQGLWIHSLNSLQQHLCYRFLPSTRFFSPSEFEARVETPLFSYKNQEPSCWQQVLPLRFQFLGCSCQDGWTEVPVVQVERSNRKEDRRGAN